MGTLYDLLGALPSDDAEGLRTAFRKAAKATHPDINPDNPDAALRFRELVRAYDILIDGEQRATYDELLAIALQPPPATKAVRTYEVIGKVASNTMAATVISAVLVAGYVLFGMFSKPPGAAEIMTDSTIGETQLVAALHPDVTTSDKSRVQRGRRIDGRRRRDIGGCTRSERSEHRAYRPFRTGPGVRLIQSGSSILSALRNCQFRPRHRSVSHRRSRPPCRARFTQTHDGLAAGKDRLARPAQAAADPASCVGSAARAANADHRSLDALSAGATRRS